MTGEMTGEMTGPGSIVGAVLFTDLVGFTAFNDACGDAEALRVLDQHLSLANDGLHGCDDGRVVKELGDGLLLWVPDARQAVGTALEVLRRAAAEHRAGTLPLQLRIGVHFGTAMSRNDDVVGHTVNVASRISDLAGPGELLVSEQALDASGDRSAGFEPVGPTTVKGVSTPVWLYRATGVAS